MKRFLLLLFIAFNFVAAQKSTYVLLISFDGFRWDYLERGITPNLDTFKEEGVRALSFKPAFPSKTFPNHLSIITGMYPENHGIISNYMVDPYTHKTYRLGDDKAVTDASWYLGEPFWVTAQRNGITAASYFWPGSEVMIDYLRPKYFMKYEHEKPYKERVDGVIDWLNLPYSERPHFITLYFHDTDSYGHTYGPNSPEINESIKRLDDITGYLLKRLNDTSIADSINIIILSDHGMTEISNERTINVDSILGEGNYKSQNRGPFMFITPAGKNSVSDIFAKLSANENHYKAYLKKDIPEYFHFSHHPFITEIVLIADLGWSLVNNKILARTKNDYYKGNHGYDNNQMDMHGLFIAKGPAFKKHYFTGTLNNIDVYPLLCKIFNISPRANIDGKAERIEFILK